LGEGNVRKGSGQDSSFHLSHLSAVNLGDLEWDMDEIDISEEKMTVAKIANFAPEIVINLAAYTDVDGCESNEEKAFAVNAEGMKHVALEHCGAARKWSI